jgi:hypothetical protein
MPFDFKLFRLFLGTLSFISLLFPVESVALSRTPQTEWWQGSSASAMLPPTPSPSPKQRVYLQKLENLAPKPYNMAYNFFILPTPKTLSIPENTAVLPAIGAPKAWINLTSNDRLAKALMMMAESPEGAESLGFLQAKRGKVLFKNLAELSPQYRDFDALAWLDKHGNWMLFINETHQNAPIPALSALISHEAMHSDAQNSKQEEAQAWMREARTWLFFTKKYPELTEKSLESYPLVYRLNEIARYLEQNDLYRFVVGHPSYAKLPETSPMFSGGATPVITAKTTENTKPIAFLGLDAQALREASTPLKGIR